MGKTINIAVVPGVGYSHLVPIPQFSKLLVHLHPYIHVTCLIPTLGSPPSSSKTILQTIPSNINYTFLQPIHPKDLLPQGTTLESQLQLTVTHSLPFIHPALKSLTLRTPLVALVADSFAVEVQDFAKEFNLLSYMYYPGAATTLSLSFYLPKLDEETSCPIEALTEEGSDNPPLYPVGPIISTVTSSGDDANRGLECLTWLDKQQPCSVLCLSGVAHQVVAHLVLHIFQMWHKMTLSFCNLYHPGSWREPRNKGWLFHHGHRRFKSLVIDQCVMHGVPLITWPLFAEQRMNAVLVSEGLKVGMRPRVNENGIVERVEAIFVISLANVGLLTHPLTPSTIGLGAWESTTMGGPNMGGYLCHISSQCGTSNSCVIKCLMEGDELCNRMKKLKENAINALKEYGSSTKTLSQLALKWRNLMHES
ncbi:hypothetical protein TSUD_353670 [Trifolium subterraneum]|uniref:Hydroquinone glucosyltransferase n=1 Tax=Trifolium subterraneum TaxID=3900 RepID=A0A2Z6N2L1_TRISU|nr:hypothetical protein TSUD_353670 [Trifolium subterraneum]